MEKDVFSRELHILDTRNVKTPFQLHLPMWVVHYFSISPSVRTKANWNKRSTTWLAVMPMEGLDGAPPVPNIQWFSSQPCILRGESWHRKLTVPSSGIFYPSLLCYDLRYVHEAALSLGLIPVYWPQISFPSHFLSLRDPMQPVAPALISINSIASSIQHPVPRTDDQTVLPWVGCLQAKTDSGTGLCHPQHSSLTTPSMCPTDRWLPFSDNYHNH